MSDILIHACARVVTAGHGHDGIGLVISIHACARVATDSSSSRSVPDLFISIHVCARIAASCRGSG